MLCSEVYIFWKYAVAISSTSSEAPVGCPPEPEPPALLPAALTEVMLFLRFGCAAMQASATAFTLSPSVVPCIWVPSELENGWESKEASSACKICIVMAIFSKLTKGVGSLPRGREAECVLAMYDTIAAANIPAEFLLESFSTNQGFS
eukprot:CAMPEP_0178892832 /NCGR_PEP_ID=MMETSP0747-20121128/19703_1 /TAXON_ID=913974 /ORGANISM="Nitzschia punctata, Strain CCMP561" /LENGTH=147 /DNA_ID=CAMNT_0020562811 /DNA_START=315 /DNA_END=758 /DNA_ORIENTATION=+